jgi:Flp pilus assembly protein TadD
MVRALITIFLCIGLAACDISSFANTKQGLKDTSNREYYPNDSDIVKAKTYFRDESYGRSYAAFKQALSLQPEDPAALLGFAASADMLRRFDQADDAYKKLEPIIGNRIEYHNNRGYSLLLRGDLVGARRHFVKAYEIDPSNERSSNNLEMLRNSVSFPKRSPGDLSGI